MGNLCSGPPPAKAPSKGAQGGGGGGGGNFGRDPNLNPEDFMVKNREGEFVVRPPGSVAGQQFLIDSCRDCDIYVFDHSAAVTVDDCENCRIFVGPCESSLFIRDCKGCSVVAVVQQFRCRDLASTDIMLYSQTRPVIESSSNLRIGCLRFGYFMLRAQFEAAGLNPWLNPWDAVHDFTAGASSHWELLPESTTGQDLLRPLPEEHASDVSIDAEGGSVVPVTRGTRRPRPPGETVIACFLDAPHAEAAPWQAALNVAEALGDSLVRTKHIQLTKAMAASLLEQGDKRGVALATRAPMVALEVTAEGATKRVADLVAGTELPAAHWRCVDPDRAARLGKQLFEEWGEEQGHSL